MNIEFKNPDVQYPIDIENGCLQTLRAVVSDYSKILVISDSNVAPLYLEGVLGQLPPSAHSFVIEAGESSKSLENATKIWELMSREEFSRSDLLIALGGGVIGDLTGYVASCYMRGIDFVQIPTTLLSMVDSSIGGKTAVNTAFAKNQIGAFHHPEHVLIDPDFLKTLSPVEFLSGLTEVIKMAAIWDAEFFEKLKTYENVNDLQNNIAEVITRACEIKKEVVESDPMDEGLRLILNFGHTFGHAIESYSGLGVVPHGIAVAKGMYWLTANTESLGLTKPGTTEQLVNVLNKFGIDYTLGDYDLTAIEHKIALDKKRRSQIIKLVILNDIGDSKILPVDIAQISTYLKRP
ncbi:MAG: 3-dehydroquinate synthase [Lactobacillales bacterium]|jgi:3-dehydroquinate synthase|nr:3-dehydroquinate synthase [Lactobacillales bacterium]